MSRFPNRIPALCAALLLVVCAALAAWWLAAGRAAHAAAENGAAPVPPLLHQDGQILVPERSPLRDTLRMQLLAPRAIEVPLALPAVVEADPARLVKVTPPAAGRVASLDKNLGDAVRAGEVLFRIDSPDLAQARSDAQKARSSVELAAQAYERQRGLAGADIVGARELEQARDALAQARSERARAESRLAQLEGAAGSRGAARAASAPAPAPASNSSAAAQRLIAVHSPLTGRVIELDAAPGGNWNDATASLMTVADLSKVYVTAMVGESDLGALFAGQAMRVVLDAYPGITLDGTVRQVGDMLDPETRRAKVRVLFDNPDGRLKPGMFATATFLSKPRDGLLVPAAAVVQSGLQSRVFVETAPWHFEPRVVRLGPTIGDQIEIAGGLAGGERIVVHDGVLLDD